MAGPKGQLKYIAWLMGVGTVGAVVLFALSGIILPLIAIGVGWAVIGVYCLFLFGVIEPGGNALGRVLVSSGSSTPSVAQHSNIESMVARGQYAKAAEAYRAVLASNPQDVVACDKLAQLALRDLKDYPLAIQAYREGEKRHGDVNRQAGYAILVAGIYRDNLKDNGKAVVELSRILSRYPGTPNADKLRAELEELKAALHLEAQ